MAKRQAAAKRQKIAKPKKLPALTPRAHEIVNFVINAAVLGTHDNDAEIGAIAKQLGMTPARLTTTVNKLQQQGWLVVQNDFVYTTLEALQWQNPQMEPQEARKLLRSLKI
jgi:DNA-binding MarR family transcriptional regulator